MKRKRNQSFSAAGSSHRRPVTRNMSREIQEIQKLVAPQEILAGSFILPYLALHDQEALAQSQPRMRYTVKNCLEKGLQLVIDNDTLLKYPVSTHEYLYKQFGSWTKKLVLNGNETVPLDTLFPLFPKITHLTLKSIEMKSTYSLGNFFPSLKSLSLINTTGTFESKLIQVDSLECLYLDGNRKMYKLPTYPTLHTLTVLNQILIWIDCPSLKTLVLDKCWNLLYHNLNKLPKLQHLRILAPVEWKTKEQIAALNLKSTDFLCMENPPEENLILRLNDDCLYHLRTFLTKVDMICLQHTHSRFLHLKINQYKKTGLKIPSRIPLKDNVHSYKAICPLYTNLTLNSVSDDILQILPMFTHLTELYLDAMEFYPKSEHYGKWIEYIPMGLQKLTLRGEVITFAPDLTKMFQGLNPTLEALVLGTTYASLYNWRFGYFHYELMNIGLDQLTNIKSFTCDDLAIGYEFNRFAMNNQYSITHLDIGLRWHHNVWENVTALGNLESLKISISRDYKCKGIPLDMKERPGSGSLALPRLKELYIAVKEMEDSDDEDNSFNYESDYDEDEDTERPILKFLKALDGTELQIFHYNADAREIQVSVFERMTNLVELSLENVSKYRLIEWPEFIPGLLVLTKLSKLSVKGLKESELLPMIQGLPMLEQMSTGISNKMYCPGVMQGIHEYLTSADRQMLLNQETLT